MINFYKKSLLLFMPLVLWAIIVIVIDPFNYFEISNIIDKQTKINNSRKVNELLWNFIQMNKNPNEYMLIGDSRTNRLPLEEIEHYSNIKYLKLTTGAIKLNEIFDIIYIANDLKKIKTLVIGINFSMFNEFAYQNRIPELQEIQNNPLRYIYNSNTAEACFLIIRACITKKNVNTKPTISREEFWDYIINVKAYEWYGKYKFPNKLYNDLIELDNFATENNIKLVFFIIPHHKQFRDKLVDYHLSNAEQKFKKIMGELNATVIDYDFDNQITCSRSNYVDPIHYTKTIGKLLVKEIWGNNIKIGKILSKNG